MSVVAVISRVSSEIIELNLDAWIEYKLGDYLRHRASVYYVLQVFTMGIWPELEFYVEGFIRDLKNLTYELQKTSFGHYLFGPGKWEYLGNGLVRIRDDVYVNSPCSLHVENLRGYSKISVKFTESETPSGVTGRVLRIGFKTKKISPFKRDIWYREIGLGIYDEITGAGIAPALNPEAIAPIHKVYIWVVLPRGWDYVGGAPEPDQIMRLRQWNPWKEPPDRRLLRFSETRLLPWGGYRISLEIQRGIPSLLSFLAGTVAGWGISKLLDAILR